MSHNSVLAGHLATERKNLLDAHQQAVLGPPDPGPIQSNLRWTDPTLTNQFYRHSAGSPHHAGAGARADNPNVELLAAGWNANRRPRQSMTNAAISADAALGRRTPPLTGTRLRPSDYPDGDEYEYGDNKS